MNTFAGNHSTDNNVRYESGTAVDASNNLIGEDPDNIFDGATNRLLRSDDDDDVATLALLEGGLAHNTGSNADAPTDYDARGFGYFRTTGGTVDIGAYEIQGTADTADDPTDLTLSANAVDENDAGAVIGTLTVDDPDSTDFIYSVSDDRFEVVNVNGTDQLRLKDGQALDHEDEAQVTFDITVFDPEGNEYEERSPSMSQILMMNHSACYSATTR